MTTPASNATTGHKTNFIANWRARPKKIKLAQKIFFVQQLSVMLKAGISLSVGLKTLSEQSSSKNFKRILLDLQQSVEKGNLLSKGLEKYQRIFGELFISMVRAGEMSGKLEDVLKQLFVQMKKDNDIISKVKGAMIYPLVVVTMMVAIGILMMVYVIPTITGVFTELNVQLPLPTRILIFLSNFSVKYGVFLAIGAVIGVIGLQRLLSTTSGKKVFHIILLKTPVVGTIIKKINIARFCRSLSSLLKTDIPIVQSFEITSRILGNVIYRQALLEAKEKIKKGINIEQSLNPFKSLFPPVVLQMIAVGEETGALDNILEESAIFYEEEVSQTMTNLPSIIEPILVVILGIGVGSMAVAVIMPMYSLSQSI
ncbi:MAG: type II secretion system F family protein [Patescibacteria group bacterium]|nr:type II secretion system F family protein [Patescibacteria group bacterium]